jgi:peptide deformylase
MSFTRKIRKLGDPVLHRPSALISDFTDPVLAQSRQELHLLLNGFQTENGFGRAIAAPQAGIGLRMIAVNLAQYATRHPTDVAEVTRPVREVFAAGGSSMDGCVFTLHNPSLTPHEDEGSITLWDDCFSFPETLVRVRRFRCVSVTFLMDDGLTVVTLARVPFWLSELLQHEVDHLDGLTSFDRAVPVDDTKRLLVSSVPRSTFAQNPMHYNEMVDVPYEP